jgi:tetratricopeptide (TPR) repeat protein
MEYLISLGNIQNDPVDVNKIFARYHNIKGTKSADNGRIKEALKEFNHAIELYPAYSPAYFNRGTIRADLGDFEGAKADFNRAKELEASTIHKAGRSFTQSYSQV